MSQHLVVLLGLLASLANSVGLLLVIRYLENQRGR
jgi:hypothetical protein